MERSMRFFRVMELESFAYSLNPVIFGHGHFRSFWFPILYYPSCLIMPRIQLSTLTTKNKNSPSPLMIAGWGIFVYL